MLIERNNKEFIIRIPASVNITEIQDVLNFIRYKELTSRFKVKQSQVDAISSSINKKWWKKNSKKIMNESSR
jgi:hypothetical protein